MPVQAQRMSHRARPRFRRDGIAAAVLAIALLARPAAAREAPDCVPVENVLWGDGTHDDTKALNAWLNGEPAIWADSGAPVGGTITGHSFRLSAAIYVRAGTGRSLADFRLRWPDRGETVSGGTIDAGSNPDQAPAASGITISGGDAGEGKPFDAPPPTAAKRDPQASCATS